MYLDRLPNLLPVLQSYQNMTTNLEIDWRAPALVPSRGIVRQHNYYFASGRFNAEESPRRGQLLAVFARNPNLKIDLRDPQAFMLIDAPFGTLDDVLVIFHSHISEKDTCNVAGSVAQSEIAQPIPPQIVPGEKKEVPSFESIKVVKGVVPEVPSTKSDAEKFTFYVNKEIARLFLLANRMAQVSALVKLEIEIDALGHQWFSA